MLNKTRITPPAAKRTLCRGLLALVCLLPALSAQASGSMSFEERLACQAALEDIRWSETIWPEQNPEPKPDRQSVLSDVQLRERVEAQLRREAVLFVDYGQHIDAARLQRELNRMARNTRAPDRLAKRFQALGNDADLIAECLARPQLVRQGLRAAYATDPHHHGQLREAAQAALASGAGIAALEASGGSEQRLVLVRRDDSAESSTSTVLKGENDVHALDLDGDDFDNKRARLTAAEQIVARPGLPARVKPLLRETDHAFVQETLLSESADRLEVRVRNWPKRSFDHWWAERRQHIAGFEAAPVNGLKLPTIQGQAMDMSSAAADSWELRSPESEPTRARRYHSAVWTGSEMIVWGGLDDGSLNTGVRYDPATDYWGAPTSTSGAPSARNGHSAVWTGSEMIVWGGFGGGNLLNTGGRYNPATDTWATPTSTSDAPSTRVDHSAVWTGSEMIVWGGAGSGNSLNTGGRYNPATDTWGTPTSTSDAPSARANHSAVWTGSEMIVWGGFDSSVANTGGRYDPTTNTWGAATATDGAPSARNGHSAVWTGSEIVVWGGEDGGFNTLNTGGRYNPDTNTWGAPTNTTNAPSARLFHSAVWTGSEMIVWGGSDDGFNSLNTGRRYNPDTNTWGPATSTDNAPSARLFHSAIWTGSEMIVWGGQGFDNQDFRLNTGRRYDPATDSWGEPTAITNAPGPRIAHSAVWTGSEMIVWGGMDGGTLNTGGRYNPATNTWGDATETSGAPDGRWLHSAVWTGSEMIVWGGDAGGFNILNSGGRYNPATDSWDTPTSTIDAPGARRSLSAVWTGSEMIVWGGSDSGLDNVNNGGRYDPAKDSWVAATATSGAPSARNSHSAVWTGSEMIVWGGFDGSETNTGGRYNPSTNTWGAPTNTTGAPGGRSNLSAVWTGSEMILWGGSSDGSSSGVLNDMALYFPYEIVLPDAIFSDRFQTN